MDDHQQLELRSLRARAYGPDSDIHDDPEALARLRDLESLARGPESSYIPPRPPLPVQTEPLVDVEPTIDVEPLVSVEAPAAEEPTAPASHAGRAGKWSKKRIAIAWLASLAVAILVTATVTGFVSRRVQADPREVAVLGVDAFAEWPGIFSTFIEDGEPSPGEVPAGGVAFEAFHGLSVYRVPDGLYSQDSLEPCLMIVPTSVVDPDSNSLEGTILTGCGVGAFSATVQLRVASGTRGLPEELLEAFPEGTGLQFVLGGDEVVVLSDQGGMPKPSAAGGAGWAAAVAHVRS